MAEARTNHGISLVGSRDRLDRRCGSRGYLRAIATLIALAWAAGCSSEASNDGATLADPSTTPPEATDGRAPTDPTTPTKPDGSCRSAAECESGVCKDSACVAPSPTDGVKNGDETDVDCGGTVAPKCATGKTCKAHGDCENDACPSGTCAASRSCRQHFGGDTCGVREIDDPARAHEDCCVSIQPGNKPYRLDKYLVTAGRMRAFIDSVTASNNGVPDIKGYTAAHRPSRWNNGWENTLPTAFFTGTASYTVSNPTVDLLYPGQDRYDANGRTIDNWVVNSGTFTVATSIFDSLNASHFFPEYFAPSPPWDSNDYGATHNFNCTNEAGSYGYSTYWFDKAQIAQYGGGVGKQFSKDDMDEKALNCTPFALFAAFCAWDGGQLMTAEVFDHVAGGPWPSNAGGIPGPMPPTPPRLTGANTTCGAPANTLNTFPDGTQSCPNVYFYPDDQGNNYDGSSRVAPPGRVPADTVAINAGDEPWMDMKGNLHEAVIKPDGLFDYRGYGIAWSSVQPHRNQITTPRMKSGAFGARCMRFK